MIYSKLNGNDTFAAYHPAIRRALDYLRAHDFQTMEPGRYEIEGDRMFVNLMDTTTRPFEGSYPEVHRNYIDLMYWPEGGEKVGVAPYLGTEPMHETRWETDIAFPETVEGENFFVSGADSFALFFPWDAHRPGLMTGDAPSVIRKAVVKIATELLK